MISARMFKIIRFLNQKKESSYKEIGNALDLTQSFSLIMIEP